MSPRWAVEVLVKRRLTLIVEAVSADEARAEAEDWHIVDELAGDTLDVEVVGVNPEVARP
jgi:hypothetical protein